ncbi:MAG TPA: hypothetical protein VK625_05600, partial [Flavitalea sp.]|nr:hypothetical protein [Flavitalea sp.]
MTAISSQDCNLSLYRHALSNRKPIQCLLSAILFLHFTSNIIGQVSGRANKQSYNIVLFIADDL